MSSFFFFNDTATTEIYTLSLHDALPIYLCGEQSPSDYSNVVRNTSGHCASYRGDSKNEQRRRESISLTIHTAANRHERSEEHTSELQSLAYLVCRLLLEKKKQNHQAHKP